MSRSVSEKTKKALSIEFNILKFVAGMVRYEIIHHRQEQENGRHGG